MQNLIVLRDPSEDAFDTSLKRGNMTFNRFCIDEDAAVELSGVYDLKKTSRKITYSSKTIADFSTKTYVEIISKSSDSPENWIVKLKRIEKGTEY